MIEASDLARLFFKTQSDPRKQVQLMLGVVTSITTGNLRVRPDGMPSGDIGPLWKNASYSPLVDHRVLCVYVPASRRWIVMFHVINQP